MTSPSEPDDLRVLQELHHVELPFEILCVRFGAAGRFESLDCHALAAAAPAAAAVVAIPAQLAMEAASGKKSCSAVGRR